MAEEVEMTPITPAEAEAIPPKISPFGVPPQASAAASATPPPAAAPAAPVAAVTVTAAPASAASAPAAPSPTATVSTIKLKPIVRKPMIRKPIVGGAKPAVPDAPAVPVASKKATQSLKAVTGPMPAQATLRKTGIIAEGILTPAQQQAAKSKTSRISLESAIGVAPVKETPAPMKTIRLRRPTDIKSGAPAPLTPPSAPAAAEASSTAETVAAPAPESGETGNTTSSQKKTLKLHRPSIGVSRPTLGVNRPSAKPTVAAAPASGDEVADMPVADMAPVTNLAPLPPVESGAGMSAGVPGWVAALSLVTSIAALVAVGTLMWYLWQEGVGPVAGANEMQFIQM